MLKKILCDFLGWHSRPLYQSFDGVSHCGYCPRCSRKLLQDSQGNWFSVCGSED